MKHYYPTLGRLFACYLHQDWATEFDSAADAVSAFIAREPAAARTAAHKEIGHLLAHESEEAGLLAEMEKLHCYYWPAGDGLTARAWLTQVAAQLSEQKT
jgi:hypothetical protein